MRRLFHHITSVNDIQPRWCGLFFLLMIIFAFFYFIFFAIRSHAFKWTCKYMKFA
ncbi:MULTISPECIES: cbb3-type cytochrome c oxidase N-terminal domain-containing protein [Lachnospiraceae]|uniref:cbb3-type cytochrome c oxidase N-terminal domain-containing protein n=1 Tax=Lachnospiraceae TaxID=186803 RepID=UPI0038BA48AE